MFSNIELKNCPDKYAFNCKNYEINCFECKANETSKYLKYSPINNSINDHPANIVQKNKGKSFSSKGIKKEKMLIKDLPLIQSTKASGIVLGDGDAYIILPYIGKLRIEIKTRFTTDLNVKPTIQEFKDGKTQNIKLYLIHNFIQKRNFFYLNYQTFVFIFKYIILNSFSFTLEGVGKYIEVIPSKTFTYFFHFVDEFHVNNRKLGNKFYEVNSFFILKNKVGTYIGMAEPTFYDLIDLYIELTKKETYEK